MFFLVSIPRTINRISTAGDVGNYYFQIFTIVYFGHFAKKMQRSHPVL